MRTGGVSELQFFGIVKPRRTRRLDAAGNFTDEAPEFVRAGRVRRSARVGRSGDPEWDALGQSVSGDGDPVTLNEFTWLMGVRLLFLSRQVAEKSSVNQTGVISCTRYLTRSHLGGLHRYPSI